MTGDLNSEIREAMLYGDGNIIQPLSCYSWPVIPPERSERVLELLPTINFDVLSFSADELMFACEQILIAFDHIERFNIPRDVLRNFIGTVRSTYIDNPYHNFHHAVDVMQTVYAFLCHADGRGRKMLEPIEVFALLVASLCHDVEHPGVNNAFMVAAKSAVATRYEGKSVLENHHSVEASRILRQPSTDIFLNMNSDDTEECHSIMRAVILATDMALHADFMARLKDWNAPLDSVKIEKEDRTFLMQILIKCADISNQAKQYDIARKWSYRVVTEFFEQGDRERAAGLPVTPMFDRESQPMVSMQIGWIEFVCKGAFVLLAKVIPNLQVFVDQLIATAEKWRTVDDKEFARVMAEHMSKPLL